MRPLPVAAEQEGSEVSLAEELYNSNLEEMKEAYKKRYNNGLLSSSELKKALLAIQREQERRKKGRLS